MKIAGERRCTSRCGVRVRSDRPLVQREGRECRIPDIRLLPLPAGLEADDGRSPERNLRVRVTPMAQ